MYPSQNVTCTGTSVQPAITTFSERNEYTYDSLARLYTKDVTIDDETFTHRYYYDRYSRLRDKDTPYGQAYNYQYDAVGNLQSIYYYYEEKIWEAQKYNKR
ncbi:hypothetical protein ACFO4O_09900, partial [Glaciecola siphonariae]